MAGAAQSPEASKAERLINRLMNLCSAGSAAPAQLHNFPQGATAKSAACLRKPTLCGGDVITGFVEPTGKRMQEHWRAEHCDREEQIAFHGSAEKRNACGV